MRDLCACGCGLYTLRCNKSKYLRHHNSKNKHVRDFRTALDVLTAAQKKKKIMRKLHDEKK